MRAEFYKSIKGYKFKLIVSIILYSISSMLKMMVPFESGKFIDDISIVGDLKKAIFRLFVIISFTCIAMLMDYFASKIQNIIQIYSATTLMTDASERYISLDGEQLSNANTAEINTIINNDSNVISIFYLGTIKGIVINFITMIYAGLSLGRVNLILLIVSVICTIASVYILNLGENKIKKANTEFVESQSKLFSVYFDWIEYWKVWKFVDLHLLKSKTNADINDLVDKSIVAQRNNFNHQTLKTIIDSIPQLLYYILGANMVIDNSLSIGGFTAGLTYLSYWNNSINYIYSLKSNAIMAQASWDRLNKLTANENITYNIHPMETALSEDFSLKMENISFRYKTKQVDRADYLIKNLSYTFQSGKIYILIGDNGTGKTTLLNLIAGINCQIDKGHIYIDDIKIDETIRHQMMKKYIAYLPQEKSYINSLTDLENLTLFNQEVKSKCVISDSGKLCKIRLPYTILNIYRAGQTLSGGQIQNILLNRVLMSERRIILLDEPTNMLDQNTKLEFLKSLRKESKNKIIIISTHDPSLRDIADEILNIGSE